MKKRDFVSVNEIQILITGDFCPINRISLLSQRQEYAAIFNDFLDVTRDNDLIITNLECPLTHAETKIDKTGPNLKANPIDVEILKYGGFNLVTMANNHTYDYGEKGLIDTLKICADNGIAHVGAGMNIHEARRPFIYKKDDISIGVLSFAENEWSTTSDDRSGANPINPIDNFHDIQNLKKKVDYVIVAPHGGHEMFQLPSPRMQKLYRFYTDAGADFVVGHHTHCYSGFEKYKEGYIFYSIGNFIFDKKEYNKMWTEGFALKIRLNKNSKQYVLIPYIQNDAKVGVRLMREIEQQSFQNDVNELCEIISDENVLNEKFEEFVCQVSQQYKTRIQPYTNKYLSYIFLRGLFPNLWSRKKLLALQNLIRCEAHRDILLKILSK
jgi:poly-gamma-glutamate synthesis protein (capsule biosynthesis protein)